MRENRRSHDPCGYTSWKKTADGVVSSLLKLRQRRKLIRARFSSRWETLSLIDNNISKRKLVPSNPYLGRDEIPGLLHL